MDEIDSIADSSGHEFEQTPGDSEGLGGLACCSSWSQSQIQLSDRTTTGTNFLPKFLPSLKLLHLCITYTSQSG